MNTALGVLLLVVCQAEPAVQKPPENIRAFLEASQNNPDAPKSRADYEALLEAAKARLADIKRAKVNPRAYNKEARVAGATRSVIVFSSPAARIKARKETEAKIKELKDVLASTPEGEVPLTWARLPHPTVGAIGTMPTGGFTVRQITSDSEAHVELHWIVGGGHTTERVLVRGFDFSNVSDDSRVSVPGLWTFTGTTRYPTASGGTRTVFVLEPFDEAQLAPYLPAKAAAQ